MNDGSCLENDCAGECGGSSVEDNCGTCDSDTTNNCVQDCAGVWGGSAEYDACNPPVCSGGTTGLVANSSCTDCNGDINGTAYFDPNCGSGASCIGGDTGLTACIQDCAGVWGGSVVEDNCGICGGECYGDISQECGDFDCDGNCVADLDCASVCGGNYIPTFQCENGKEVCNPADCNSMDISPYLLPDEFGISKIFPNPFNPVTHIQYELTQFGLISIKIYDIQGRVVDQLMNEYQSPGHYSLNWNAGNHASGMYIVEMVMQLENNEVSRDLQKILYLK